MKEFYKNYINKDHDFVKTSLIGIFCLIIVMAGMFGFLYEFIFYYLNGGMQKFYWRGGNFLPWINIYAIGAIMIYILTYRFRKNPLKVFLVSFLSCGILEYLSGLGIYIILHGKRFWDYNTEILSFGNIQGFVCLRSALIFGISGLFLMYFFVPLIFYIAKRLSKKTFLIISIALCSIFMFDELYNLIFSRVLSLPRAYDVYKKIGFNYVKFK